MNISEAAKRSGLAAKTIRYYEDIGLVAPARSANGYRVYSDRDVHMLVFLAEARGLGFGIDDCRVLVDLYEDRGRASADVRAVALAHLDGIEAKINALRAMQTTLRELVDACAGDDRPDCPILDRLAVAPTAAVRAPHSPETEMPGRAGDTRKGRSVP